MIDRRKQYHPVAVDRRRTAHSYNPPPAEEDSTLSTLGTVLAVEAVVDAFNSDSSSSVIDTSSSSSDFGGFDGGSSGGGGASSDW